MCTQKNLVTAFLATMSVAACSGSNPSSGQTAYMRIQNAQFIAGSIDTADHGDQPKVHTVATRSNDVLSGVSGKLFSGDVGPGSTGILIGLLGDSGYWTMPVQDMDQNTPGDFTFSCTASFSLDPPSNDGGQLTLIVRATDKEGHVGPASPYPLRLREALPEGALVISLDWDTQADLDLHVVLPSGDAGLNEIWSRKPSGLPVGTKVAPDDVDAAIADGYLDHDSNSQCVIDGRRNENVIFPVPPPDGHYIVRVDTFSLCSEVTARWRVQVLSQGTLMLQAFGQSTDTDTRFPHGQGAGVQALVFDYNL